MKLWVDDVREPPGSQATEYEWCHTVNGAISVIEFYEMHENPIELIDIDHDAGDFVHSGGDYINLLNWLEETDRNYPIRIHSMNPVGVQNMRAIIEHNRWTEVR